MQRPTVSVMMPVFNAETYLAEAVESVLTQTFVDFEFLIIDDGSTDRSKSILQDYAERDSRIRLTNQANTGYVVALSRMIDQAQGTFLARMDADDICHRERFQRQVAVLETHDNIGAVGSAVQLIDAQSRFLRLENSASDHNEIQQRLLRGECPVCHPAVMMRADTLRRVGGYRATYEPAEDRDLWLRIGEVAEVVNLPEPLLQYRLHHNSISQCQREKQVAQLERICRDAWGRRGISGTFSANTDLRPTNTRRSRSRFETKYGWWAFRSGHNKTAFHYAMSAIGILPWHRPAWTLLACCIREWMLPSNRLVQSDPHKETVC